MTRKKVRFYIAVGASAAAWMIALYYLFGTSVSSPGAFGNWIQIYPHPVIVMLITALVIGISAWMWAWYRRDRVDEALFALDEEERRRLLDRLLSEASERLTLADDGEFEVETLPPKKEKHRA